MAASYLGAYFFLLFLKLAPTEASPLTLPRYAYYYWDNREVRSRLIGAGALALLLVGGMALIVALPRRRSLHGDARWAKARDIRRAGLLADQGIILGRYKNRYLMLPGQTGCHPGGAPALGQRRVLRRPESSELAGIGPRARHQEGELDAHGRLPVALQ